MPRVQLRQKFKTLLLGCAVVLGAMAVKGRAQAEDLQTTVVAGGCFWCVESDFESVDGVLEVVSGYAGNGAPNPSYDQVTAGGSGYLEAVEITYDADRLSYEQILHLFLRSIDVTDAGGQFCDRGESYTTAIFTATSNERAAAEAAVARAEAELGQSVVTPIRDAAPFYPAEEYHQDFYRSDDRILTRFGPRRKSRAYELYRNACGRDDRVSELWGDAAPFAGSH